MSLLVTILIVFLILVIIYYLIDWATGKSTKLSHIRHARTKTISGHKIKGGGSSNFTMSIWFYVDDWSFNYGKTKPLLQVQSGGKSTLDITLGAESNDINMNLGCFATSKDTPPSAAESSQGSIGTTSATCNVQNFPLQKWVNLIVSAYGRTLDVYIDGKLVKTCVLPGPVAMSNIQKVVLTDGSPSFRGMTADVTYWPEASNPQQAYNIYASGFGGMGTNFFSKYKIKVSFLEDGKTEGSFEI